MTNPPPPPGAAPPPPPPLRGTPPPPPPTTTGHQPASLGKRRSIGLVILLSIVTLGIWTIVWSYQNGDELKRWSGNGVGGTGYLLIMLGNLIAGPIPAIIVMFLLAGEVENLYRAEGREPPITTIWGLWFLLPIIGSIIWYVRIQRSINDYWELHGQTTTSGL